MAAAPFLLCLLLIASAGTAAGDDGARELPHLEIPNSGHVHASASGDDGASLPHLELPDSGRAHGSATPPQGLMGLMARSGCGSFEELLRATPNASAIIQERVVNDDGLTVFCPDDKAVAGFAPAFRALNDRDRLAVLLLHGVPARYGRAQLAGFKWVEVRTLAAADAASNKSQTITIHARNDGDRVWLWPSKPSCKGGEARIVKNVSSEEGPLAVYLVDAVLVPCHLRQKLGGEDEAAACGGLHFCIPLPVLLSFVAGAIVGSLGSALWIRMQYVHACEVLRSHAKLSQNREGEGGR